MRLSEKKPARAIDSDEQYRPSTASSATNGLSQCAEQVVLTVTSTKKKAPN